MSIYKSDKDKEAILSLYERQLERLDKKFEDIYIDTTFGKTHLIETGNFTGVPLLVFHGGNATTAYNLLGCDFLMKDFHIYAVDTIGHPGKSAEVCLSPNNYDYGRSYLFKCFLKVLFWEIFVCLKSSSESQLLS